MVVPICSLPPPVGISSLHSPCQHVFVLSIDTYGTLVITYVLAIVPVGPIEANPNP